LAQDAPGDETVNCEYFHSLALCSPLSCHDGRTKQARRAPVDRAGVDILRRLRGPTPPTPMRHILTRHPSLPSILEQVRLVGRAVSSVGRETECEGAIRLDAEAGLPPVPPLCVVPIHGVRDSARAPERHRLAVPSILDGHARAGRSVVPDGVAGPETNPLRDRPVLLLRLGELLLRTERLVALDERTAVSGLLSRQLTRCVPPAHLGCPPRDSQRRDPQEPIADTYSAITYRHFDCCRRDSSLFVVERGKRSLQL